MNRNNLLKIIRNKELEIEFSESINGKEDKNNALMNLEVLGEVVIGYDNLIIGNRKRIKNLQYLTNKISKYKNIYVSCIEKIKDCGIDISGLPRKLNYIGVQN